MTATNESLDLCSVKTFAELSGVTVEEVINWVDSQTIPSMKLADFRMVNLACLRPIWRRVRPPSKRGTTPFVKAATTRMSNLSCCSVWLLVLDGQRRKVWRHRGSAMAL